MAKGSGLPKMKQDGGKYAASGSGMTKGRTVGASGRNFGSKTKNVQTPMSKQPMPTNKRSGK